MNKTDNERKQRLQKISPCKIKYSNIKINEGLKPWKEFRQDTLAKRKLSNNPNFA